MNPFLPTQNPKVLRLIRKAAAHNDRLDAIDRKLGGKTPAASGLSELLRTAMTAILCGIEIGGWDEVAEGYVMLMQAECMTRKLESQLDIVIKEEEQ